MGWHLKCFGRVVVKLITGKETVYSKIFLCLKLYFCTRDHPLLYKPCLSAIFSQNNPDQNTNHQTRKTYYFSQYEYR